MDELKHIILEQLLEEISQKSPPLVTREKGCLLTGGAFSVKTFANRDSLGQGIIPRLRIGNKVVYPRDAFISFIRENLRIEGSTEGGEKQ